jgi:uncharacterized OB-fold protein
MYTKRNRPCRMCGIMMYQTRRRFCPECNRERYRWQTAIANSTRRGLLVYHLPQLCEECGEVFLPLRLHSRYCLKCSVLMTKIFVTMVELRSRFANKMICDREAALAFAEEMEAIEGKDFRDYALDGIPDKSFVELVASIGRRKIYETLFRR